MFGHSKINRCNLNFYRFLVVRYLCPANEVNGVGPVVYSRLRQVLDLTRATAHALC